VLDLSTINEHSGNKKTGSSTLKTYERRCHINILADYLPWFILYSVFVRCWADRSDKEEVFSPADHHPVDNPCTPSTALSVRMEKAGSTGVQIALQQTFSHSAGVGTEAKTDTRIDG
jgi:hypothetical protein